MDSGRNILKDKLDEFIRKYYLNRMLQGFLSGTGLLLALLIAVSVLEYFGHFDTPVRAGLFFAYLIFCLYIFVRYILIPFLQSRKIGRTLNEKEASLLVGRHFPDIADKLLNTLQLQDQQNSNDSELLRAGIEQRIAALRPFSFKSAVDFRSSLKKYGKTAAVPFMLLLLILLFQSSFITSPAERILNFSKKYSPPLPFRFILVSDAGKAVRNTDLKIEVELSGRKLPDAVYIRLDGHDIKMEQSGRNRYVYTITNLTRDVRFLFTDGRYESGWYTCNVLPDPSIRQFQVKITPPLYTGRKTETIENTGDLTVPEGSMVNWSITASDAEELVFRLGTQFLHVDKNGDVFTCNEKIKEPINYSVLGKNKAVSSLDTIFYSIQTIRDRAPSITAEQKFDSLNPYRVYFYGKADDDYGISKLNFVYSEQGGQKLRTIPVPNNKTTDEIFYFAADLNKLGIEEGTPIEYFFEVWDNDAVNGRKNARTQVFSTKPPDLQELRAQSEQSGSALKSKMNEAMREISELQKSISSLEKDLSESRQMDWQHQEKVRNMIETQKKLERKLDEIRQNNRMNNEKEKFIGERDEEFLKKQAELEKLFNELMTPEMKEMLRKMEEMLKQQNKEAIRRQMDQIKNANDEARKQVDRALEQMKLLELEKRIQDEVRELRNLSKEQKELSKKTGDKNTSKEEILKKQEEIRQKFEKLSEEMEQTREKNKQLQTPLEMESLKKEEESVQKSLEESENNLRNRQNKKAAEKQQETSDEMDELAEKMEKSLEKAQEEQEAEDYYTLRQILENLIELSLQQEQVMNSMKELSGYGPRFVELSARQRKLQESAKMVEDSLLALSKRQIHIRSIVNKEIGQINSYMNLALDQFSKVRIQNGAGSQQYVMTGLNNLAVLLSESLKNMQESMKEKKNGSKQCQNPGKKPGKPGSSGKPKMSGMKKQQDEINRMLQEMKQGRQQGKTPGSEQFARMAARQEALRREMERLQKLLKEEGNEGALGDMGKTKRLMEEIEKDLVNKQITPETIRRMQEIETRMLEHEKAEREQENDPSRQAEQGEEISREIPPSIREYLEKKAKEMELLKSVPNELSPYYKDRVRLYFQKLGGPAT